MGAAEWRAVLAQYGQTVTLRRDGEEKEIRAFFQPVDERVPGEEPTPLGIAPAGMWLYLGPPEEELDQVTEVDWEGRTFELLRRREVPLGTGTLYQWALARERDEAAE